MKMKKYRYILIAALLGMSSCSGFLEEIDQDKFIPRTADHFAALLLQEFNYNPGIMAGTQLMTDEVAEIDSKTITAASFRRDMKPVYTWQREIELREDGSRAINNASWRYLYRQIAIANYVIELIEDSEGTPEEIAFVKGEAYFIRAYCYFVLTNLYAEPYESATQARITYGVPLRTDIGVLPRYDKSMLGESYDLIESDLAEARRLIGSSGITKSLYHPRVTTCDLLLSRVKLYKKEYGEAIEAATQVINNAMLMRMNAGGETRAFITQNNPEVLYSMAVSASASGGISPNNMTNFSLVVNPRLYGSFHDDDQRKRVFFAPITNPVTNETNIYPRKGDATFTELGKANMRVAEAYLNRAEAYAFTGRYDLARQDLTALLSRRYLNDANIVIPAGGQALIDFIFEERFKELCFEVHHRWFDLRRMGESMRPEIVHRFSIMDSGSGQLAGVETYTLLKNDRNYTLAVPLQERDNNPFIRNYERFDKLPEFREEVRF
jgi:tetratricopeptide (TPR) repeat protein